MGKENKVVEARVGKHFTRMRRVRRKRPRVSFSIDGTKENRKLKVISFLLKKCIPGFFFQAFNDGQLAKTWQFFFLFSIFYYMYSKIDIIFLWMYYCALFVIFFFNSQILKKIKNYSSRIGQVKIAGVLFLKLSK